MKKLLSKVYLVLLAGIVAFQCLPFLLPPALAEGEQRVSSSSTPSKMPVEFRPGRTAGAVENKNVVADLEKKNSSSLQPVEAVKPPVVALQIQQTEPYVGKAALGETVKAPSPSWTDRLKLKVFSWMDRLYGRGAYAKKPQETKPKKDGPPNKSNPNERPRISESNPGGTNPNK